MTTRDQGFSPSVSCRDRFAIDLDGFHVKGPDGANVQLQ